MTQSSDRLDRIEATLERMAAQAEMDRRDFRERMDQIQQQAEADRQQLRENLATLTDISIDFMRVTREAIEELRASNEELRASNRRQERINDFLLRERGLNGG
jgi:hypothetical protein